MTPERLIEIGRALHGFITEIAVELPDTGTREQDIRRAIYNLKAARAVFAREAGRMLVEVVE